MADALEDKLEWALLAVLSDAGAEELGDGDITLGEGVDFQVQDKSYAIVASVQGGIENPPNSNTYALTVKLTAYAPADVEEDEDLRDDPKEMLSKIVQLIRSAILVQGIEALLSDQQPDFTVFLVNNRGPDAPGFDGRHFFRSHKFEVICSGADF